ncbi:MAG: DUF4160 domain-containing protein [bacterium]|nr:DUF4160 domain-containing protein [bacterium]
MPELCRFYGIVIQMYYGDHPPPHFHAKYGGHEAVVDIDNTSPRGWNGWAQSHLRNSHRPARTGGLTSRPSGRH